MAFIRNVRFFIWLAFVQFLRLFSRIYKTNRNEQKKILIVFINAIGDFILFSSVLPIIRDLYTGYDIELIGFNRWTDLAERTHVFSSIIEFERDKFLKSIFYRFIFLLKISKNRYNIVINPSYSRMWIGDLIVATVKGNEKIGYDGDINNLTRFEKKLGDRIYDFLIKYDLPNSKRVKEIEVIKNFVNSLGAKAESIHPRVWLTAKDRSNAKKLLRQMSVTPFDKYTVIVPGAASEKRIWNSRNYIPIIKWLNHHNYKVLFCGSKNDSRYFEDIKREKVNFIDLFGKTSLPVLAAIIEKSSLYIGTETGPLQMATAFKVPSICIMGGGHFKRFYPYIEDKKYKAVYHKMDCFYCNWKCIYDKIVCIEEIRPQQVLDELELMKEEEII